MDTRVHDVMITTYDNPYSPFTEFKEWDAYDKMLGHNTTALLARLAYTSHELPDDSNYFVIEQVIDEIVREDVLGVYRKIGRDEKPIVIPID